VETRSFNNPSLEILVEKHLQNLKELLLPETQEEFSERQSLKSEGASRHESDKKFSPKNNLQIGILDMTVVAQDGLKHFHKVVTTKKTQQRTGRKKVPLCNRHTTPKL
jgi:hypothetical protein